MEEEVAMEEEWVVEEAEVVEEEVAMEEEWVVEEAEVVEAETAASTSATSAAAEWEGLYLLVCY
jgi:hypothetical protein